MHADRKRVEQVRKIEIRCIFSLDLFKLYSEIILRKLKDSPVLIIGVYNPNNIKQANSILLVADSEGKLKELLDKIVKVARKNINCKKRE